MLRHHRSRRRSGLFALAGVVVLLAAVSANAQSGDEEMDMHAMIEAATPGPHHKALETRAGDWKVSSRMWIPGQEAMESSGTSKMKSVLGGRFLEEVVQAPMMGQPWEGRGVFGYNNVSKKHIATWYDTFGTMIMSFEGTCENHCKKITMSSDFVDPMTGSEVTMKTVSEQKGDNTFVTTLYNVVDGKDMKTGEIRYERAGSQAKR